MIAIKRAVTDYKRTVRVNQRHGAASLYTWFKLTLECGHTESRRDRGGGPPGKAKCEQCTRSNHMAPSARADRCLE